MSGPTFPSTPYWTAPSTTGEAAVTLPHTLDCGGRPRAVCAGEAMLVLLASGETPFGMGSSCSVSLAGAESNVAVSLAQLGVASDWLSVLGVDGLSRSLMEDLERRGVRVLARFVEEPTGIVLRTPRGHEPRNLYYRSGSAASRLDKTDVHRVDWHGLGLVHVSGITAVLSASAEAFTEALIAEARRRGVMVSFDLNYRPALSQESSQEVLLRLARQCDVFFAGRDEVRALFGVEGDAAIRDLFAGPELVVLKDEGRTVVALGKEQVLASADPVPIALIVDEIGAGDAFAAGFLSGLLSDQQIGECLRRGNEAAGIVMGSHEDTPPLSHQQVKAILEGSR